MFDSKRLHGDSLIQVKLLDDMYPGAYGPGTSMRNSGTVDECRFEKQVHKTEVQKKLSRLGLRMVEVITLFTY